MLSLCFRSILVAGGSAPQPPEWVVIIRLYCLYRQEHTMSKVLQIGSPAPDFALPAHTGGTVRLSSYQGQQRVVLYFMREFM